MTTYYVGPGGNNSNNGLSWANRKLTLNGAEDIPVIAGDIVYVAPGIYRELLTIDVSGSAGNPITYIADVTGQNTDGVGGIVRITGSDNDQTATRANAITATSRNYRTFRGFSFDTTTSHLISLATACSNWIIEDCFFDGTNGPQSWINAAGTGTTHIIRRCMFMGCRGNGLIFTNGAVVDNAAHVVENCLFMAAPNGSGVRSERVGGITVKNCSFVGIGTAIRVSIALTVGQTLTVNNCILAFCSTALQATTTAEFAEDYNTLWGNVTDRNSVSTGANSVIYAPLFLPPMLVEGYRFGRNFGELAPYSLLAAKAGSGMSSNDFFGTTRPSTDSKKSWGAMQVQPMLRETATVHSSSAASLRLSDAGQHMMFVPVTNVSTVFSVYVQWEADYAGTKPQMIIRQPGQADTVVTATGSSGSWEQLTTTLTPAATPGYVVVIFVSSNTATSGNYDTFFDSFTVS